MSIIAGDGVFWLEEHGEQEDHLRFDIVLMVEYGLLKLRTRHIHPRQVVLIVRKRAFDERLVELP